RRRPLDLAAAAFGRVAPGRFYPSAAGARRGLKQDRPTPEAGPTVPAPCRRRVRTTCPFPGTAELASDCCPRPYRRTLPLAHRGGKLVAVSGPVAGSARAANPRTPATQTPQLAAVRA